MILNMQIECWDVKMLPIPAAGVLACIGDWCPGGKKFFQDSLDGVVRIYYNSKKFEPNT